MPMRAPTGRKITPYPRGSPSIINEDEEEGLLQSDQEDDNDNPPPPPAHSPEAISFIGKVKQRKSHFFLLLLVFSTLLSYKVLSVIVAQNSSVWEEVQVINEPPDKTSLGVSTTTTKPSTWSTSTKPGPILQFAHFNGSVKNTSSLMACQLPQLDPFDPSILHLIKDDLPNHVNCTGDEEAIYPFLFSSYVVKPSALVTVGVDEDIRSCHYQNLDRGDPGPDVGDPDNQYTLSEETFPLSIVNGSRVVLPPETEFIAISCRNSSNNSTVVMDMHAFVPPKTEVESRVNRYYKALGRAGYENPILQKDRVNVVILGVDAVSHMNFLRIMPKTYEYLMKTLSAVEMHGFNKVGDNTYPNLAAGLTSLNESTLEETCQDDRAFDNCPFIWKDYASQGYRTAYGEDSTWMGIFNYIKKGFKRPPTDYYLRPFGVGAERLIGHCKPSNARLCYGPRLTFRVLLDYMKKMAHFMGNGEEDKRYFQFIWATSLTHDYLNYGTKGDDHLLSMLKWFNEGGYFNRSIFVLMSDHGIRWGPIHDYLQGQLEERLPFLYYGVPKWFQKRYPKAYSNLKLNQRRLTTFFDFHETLHDLLNLPSLKDSAITSRETSLQDLSHLPRGISQFLPIPLGRTCEMAEIPEHYCTCHRLKPVPTSDPNVTQAANYVLHQINSMLLPHPECGILSLHNITKAHMKDLTHLNTTIETSKGGGPAYELAIHTLPGNAIFEASVIRNETGGWDLSGTVSRTNLYGNQSHCVDDKELKLYCYCIDLI